MKYRWMKRLYYLELFLVLFILNPPIGRTENTVLILDTVVIITELVYYAVAVLLIAVDTVHECRDVLALPRNGKSALRVCISHFASQKEVVIFIPLIVFASLADYYFMGNLYTLLLAVLFMSRKFSFDEIKKPFFFAAAAVFVLPLILYFARLLPGYGIFFGTIFDGHRYGLGFGNPNNLGIAVLSLLIVSAAAFGEKRRLLFTVIIAAGGLLGFLFEGSRAALALCLIFATLTWFTEIKGGLRKAVKRLFFLMPVIMLCVTIILALVFKDELRGIDVNFEVRFQDLYKAVRLRGLTFFPQDWSDSDELRLFFDNAYTSYMMHGGVIGLIGMLGSLLVINYRMCKTDDLLLMYAGMLLYIDATMELPSLYAAALVMMMVRAFSKTEKSEAVLSDRL